MIGTEQERAALMAHVRSYGHARDKAAHEREMGDYEASERWNKSAREYLDAIRAMLAPDDAVLRERELRLETVARAAYADWVASKWDWGSDELRTAIHACVDANDFGLLPVLRGEATR